MKRKMKIGVVTLSAMLLLAGCGQKTGSGAEPGQDGQEKEQVIDTIATDEAVRIVLSDEAITVDGEAVSGDSSDAVYTAKDIVYYEGGKDFTYGEGTTADEHTTDEADAHTVVHITKPGTYAVSGKLSAGQLAIDLGEDAEKDSQAVVNLILDGVDINCSVAPAVIFYNVYECGSTEEENATKDVDTSAAGANVIIADGTENNISGSYVARIYKSVELNEDGTEVVDSKKLHKYDAAFYSKMSMNVYGEEEGTGVLNITAENEGLDSELHLTINGGNININSGNDGINTNEDSISVTTINGGNLNIVVDGSTGEGDGIDSNGWLVINGGTVVASACEISSDAGIDSDMGIHINGGTVIATGNMLDHISESAQNYAVFSFNGSQKGATGYALTNASNEVIVQASPTNGFTYLIFSTPDMKEGNYTLWSGETQMAGASGGAMMAGGPAMGGGRPGGFGGEKPNGMEMPEGMEQPQGMERPEGVEKPEKMEHPEGMERPKGGRGGRGEMGTGEVVSEFVIAAGGNYFSNVGVVVE